MEQEILREGIIRKEKAGPVGRLVVSNPERRNAMTLSMWEDLPRRLDAFEQDADVRVVVITGEGTHAFVSGADISEFTRQRHSREAVAAYETRVAAALERIRAFPKPVIARINGHCIGGGLALALACDMRVAIAAARFGVPAARLGLGYEYPGIQKLVGIVGEARAAEMMFTARLLDAGEARDMGLLNAVVEAGDLDRAVDDLARDIAALAPLSIRAAKAGIRAAVAFGEEGLRREADKAVAQCAASLDYAEGIAAFMEKRAARFVGR